MTCWCEKVGCGVFICVVVVGVVVVVVGVFVVDSGTCVVVVICVVV